MASPTHDLVTAYIQAVGEHRLESVVPMLDPAAEFTVGDDTYRGAEAFIGALKPLLPIIVRNDIRKVFVEGDEAVVIYDFVTDTPVGAVLSVEHIKVRDGHIASTLLVFERLHWPEVRAALAARATPETPRASA